MKLDNTGMNKLKTLRKEGKTWKEVSQELYKAGYKTKKGTPIRDNDLCRMMGSTQKTKVKYKKKAKFAHHPQSNTLADLYQNIGASNLPSSDKTFIMISLAKNITI